MTEQTQVEDKVWERPWNSDELITNSTNWSLAGDAGLLLNLKRFSENFMSKAADIEKELQKLIFEEQQCHVKFENTNSSFLQLENTQFIENRVYEQDVTDTNVEPVKTEKTKEEKELELLEIINESVRIGISIMDTYFDKIEGSKSDEESDAEDDLNAEDVVIYESKDPYVLRSLPYLIGTEAYLENDHVGLKDLDEEEEDEEENLQEEEAEEVEEESDIESESETESSLETGSSESEEELFTKPIKKENLFDESEEEKSDIFNPTKKNDNLFEESEKSEAEESESEEEKSEPVPKSTKPPVLDFASELSRKIALKANKQEEKSQKTFDEDKNEEIFSKPKQTQANNLFDDEPEENSFNKKSENVPKIKNIMKNKSLFDDDDEDDDLFNKPEEKTKPTRKEEMPTSSKPFKTEVNNLKSEATKEIFEENESLSKKPQVVKPSPASSNKTGLFDDESEEEIFKPPANSKPVTQVKKSLFDESDEEDLFTKLEKKPVPKLEVKIEAEKKQEPTPVVQNKSSLFDDEEEDDLFSKPINPPIQKQVLKEKEESTTESKSVKIVETKASLFDDDDDEDDLFNKTKKEEKKIELQKEESAVAKPKLVQKNVLFDPSALKSSNLFKKFVDEKKSDTESDDEWGAEDKKEKNEKVVESKLPDPFANFEPEIKKVDSVSKEEKSSDIFDNFSVGNQPASLVNNAQKVKIEAEKKQEPTPVVQNKSSLFDDEEEDDLFSKPINPPIQKQVLKEKEESTTESKSVKIVETKASLFDDDDDEDDLFNKTKKEEKKIELQKEESAVAKPKLVQKNVLFDPSALKSSNLFKKFVDEKKSDTESDDEWGAEDKKEKNEKVVESKLPDPFANFEPEIKKVDSVSKEEKSSDIFDNFSVGNQPASLVNNAQKDRIKAAKKRAPLTQRKRTINSQEDSTFQSNNSIESTKNEKSNANSENNQKSNEEISTKDGPKNLTAELNKFIETKKQTSDIFDDIKIEDDLFQTKKKPTIIFDTNDDDDIFKVDLKAKVEKKPESKQEPKKTTQNPKQPTKSLFDDLDEDDIFSSKPKKQETKIQEKKEIIKKENQAKEGVLDGLDDDEDIFAVMPKKKEDKKKEIVIDDNIFFDDPLSSFK